jgi:hypothetical protein
MLKLFKKLFGRKQIKILEVKIYLKNDEVQSVSFSSDLKPDMAGIYLAGMVAQAALKINPEFYNEEICKNEADKVFKQIFKKFSD